MREYTSKGFYHYRQSHLAPLAGFDHHYHMHVKVPENDLMMPSVRDQLMTDLSNLFDDNGLKHLSWREASDIFVYAFQTKADAAKARILSER